MFKNIFLSGPGKRVTVDGVDIASGVGYKRYYGVVTRTSATALLLTTLTLDSDGTSRILQNTISVTDDTLLNTYTFDLTFKQTQFIDGDAFVNVTYGAEGSNSTGTYAFLKVRLLKRVGTTNIIIGTQQQTENVATTAGDENVAIRKCLDFVVSRTKFIKGDVFRVEIEVWGKKVGVNNGNADLWVDPTNRVVAFGDAGNTVFTSNSSTFETTLPFLVNL